MTNTPVSFESVRPRRAVDDIIGQIRERIRTHELIPGQKLPSERELADQMGVSRNTVREAIRMLEVSGLVTIRKGATGGAFLSTSNSNALSQILMDGIALQHYSFQDLVAVRSVLETYIVEQACLKATDDELQVLDDLAKKSLDAETSEPNFEKRVVIHLDFHRELARVSHNTVAETVTNPLLQITQRFHQEAGPIGNMETHRYRRQLMDALWQRDCTAAVEAMQTHLEVLADLGSAVATQANS